jgi:hypothetical protein
MLMIMVFVGENINNTRNSKNKQKAVKEVAVSGNTRSI